MGKVNKGSLSPGSAVCSSIVDAAVTSWAGELHWLVNIYLHMPRYLVWVQILTSCCYIMRTATQAIHLHHMVLCAENQLCLKLELLWEEPKLNYKPFFFLFMTPPFISITTFYGRNALTTPKESWFWAGSLQEPGRLSWELIFHTNTICSSSPKGSHQWLGQACRDQIAAQTLRRGLPFLSRQFENACQ